MRRQRCRVSSSSALPARQPTTLPAEHHQIPGFMHKSWWNIFFGLPPEGITVFLGFGSDCSLFSQKELHQGSGLELLRLCIWRSSKHLSLGDTHSIYWESATLAPHMHTVSGRRYYFWEIYCHTSTQQLCLSSHAAVG